MKIVNLKKTYFVKKGKRVEALKGIDFNLPDHGMIFVVGKTGCGKTTLLNLLAGLDEPTEGKILFHGKDIAEMTSKEREEYRNSSCGFVFQNYNLIEGLSAGENVALSLEMQGKRDREEQVKNALRSVGLEGYESRRISELSGGQRQRVAIARATVKNPEIIFADEPTGALDEETSGEIFDLLKEISKNSLVVVVSHDSIAATKYADGVIRLSDGKIVANDLPSLKETSADFRSDYGKKTINVPWRTAAKIGLTTVKKHPVRFFVALVLSAFSFLLFSVPFSISLWNNKKAYLDEFFRSGSEFSTLNKYRVVYQNVGYQDFSFDRFLGADDSETTVFCPFTQEEIAYLKSIAGSPLIPVNQVESYAMQSQIGGDWRDPTKLEEFFSYYDKYIDDHYSWEIKGFVGIDEDTLDFLHYKILAGNLPQTVREVAVPECIYNTFQTFGLIDSDGQEYVVSSPDDLIGHDLDVSSDGRGPVYLKITAVIETGCDKQCQKNHLQGEKREYEFHDKAYVCNDYLSLDNILNTFVYPTPADRDAFRNMTDYLVQSLANEKDNGRTYIGIYNDYSRILYFDQNDMPMLVARLCLYLGIVFLFFASLQTFVYISSSLGGKSKQAGVLIASGFSRKDILKTYGIFAFLSGFSIFLLSFLLFFPTSKLMNIWFSHAFFEGIGICGFYLLVPVVTFLSSTLVSVLSCVIPVVVFLKQTPAALISGRKRK